MSKSQFFIKGLIIGVMWLIPLTASMAAELKIGFVNAPRVIDEAPQAKQAQKQLEKEFDPRKKDIDKMQKSLRKMEDKLNRDGAIMSEAEQLKLEREIRNTARDLKRAKDEFREDLTIRKNEAFERLRRRVFEVIQTIATQKKFDLIISEGVLHASKKVDITNLVLKQLNKEMSSQNGKQK